MEEHSLSQRALAETLGTALLVLVGPGSVVATLVLAGDKVPAIDGSDLLGISFAFGLVITALVYAIGKVSGCHINPAVTFALATTKRFPWREVPTYWGSQLVGGALGALGIWALFTQTGVDMGLGSASFNEDTYSWGTAIFAEFIGTAILMFAILGIVDSRSPGDFAGIVIGGVVVAIIMVIGPITAASLNPARAFGPELALSIADGTTHWNQLDPRLRAAGIRGRCARGVRLRLPRNAEEARAADRARGDASRSRRSRPGEVERTHISTVATPMKKLLNDPANLVKESLDGLAAAHGDLVRYDADAQILVRATPAADKVGLISGGGSGHEPMHGGFVGAGMLDAACPGEVFTSPVPEQMLAATKAVDTGKGVVHVVKNYTGDVMNFKLAAEDAEDEGIQVEAVLIDDDVAVQDSLYTAGRRGVGATVLARRSPARPRSGATTSAPWRGWLAG